LDTLKSYLPLWTALVATLSLVFGAGLYNTYFAKRYIVYQAFFPPSGTIHLHLKNISKDTCTKPANFTFGLTQGKILDGKVADTNEPSTSVAVRAASAPGLTITAPRLTAAAGYITLEVKYEGGSRNGVELVPPETIGCDNGVFYLSRDVPGSWNFTGPVLIAIGLAAAAVLLLGVVLGVQRMV
jgi:hypothetical protein